MPILRRVDSVIVFFLCASGCVRVCGWVSLCVATYVKNLRTEIWYA